MKTFTLEQIASLTGSQLVGKADHVIKNAADLESATSEDVSFLANPRYEQVMRRSDAGAIFIHPNYPHDDQRSYLLNENPSLAFQKVVEAFLDGATEITGFKGVHPTAVVHETAQIHPTAQIGPYAVIDQNVKIGALTNVGAHCYIGPYTIMGEHCQIHPHVTIRERCQLGNRVAIQPGAVIGSCGFGYTQDKEGRHLKLNQVGTVTLEDDVEIGANTTIDRSRFKTTLVKRGSKIDNLVQLAHGVIIGEDTLVIAQTGIAGSTEVGNHTILAGQVAVAGHLKIGDHVMVAARSGVSKSLPKPGKYNGVPCVPLEEYNRNAVHLRNVGKLYERVKVLESKINNK